MSSMQKLIDHIKNNTINEDIHLIDSNLDDAFLIALKVGNLEVIKYCINKDARMNEILAINLEYFNINIEKNRLPVVDFLLRQSFINLPILNMALCKAIPYYNYEMIKCILVAGADIHSEEDYLLRAAIFKEDTDLTLLALKYDADISARDNEVIRHVSSQNNIKLFKLLEEHGADLHCHKSDDEFINLLSINTYYNNKELVQHLISKKIFDKNAYALVKTAKNIDLDIAHLLLENNSYSDEEKHSAFIQGVKNNNLEFIKILHSTGIDLFKNRFEAVGIIRDNDDLPMAQYFYANKCPIEMFIGCDGENVAKWSSSTLLSKKLNKELPANEISINRKKI